MVGQASTPLQYLKLVTRLEKFFQNSLTGIIGAWGDVVCRREHQPLTAYSPAFVDYFGIEFFFRLVFNCVAMTADGFFPGVAVPAVIAAATGDVNSFVGPVLDIVRLFLLLKVLFFIACNFESMSLHGGSGRVIKCKMDGFHQSFFA